MDPKILTTHAITPVCDSGRLELKARGCGEGKRRREGSGDTLGGVKPRQNIAGGAPREGQASAAPKMLVGCSPARRGHLTPPLHIYSKGEKKSGLTGAGRLSPAAGGPRELYPPGQVRGRQP